MNPYKPTIDEPDEIVWVVCDPWYLHPIVTHLATYAVLYVFFKCLGW
jgi:hypothetical protein